MRNTKVVSICSGKGGVGKTSLVCRMGAELSRRGRKVLILDGDFGLANVEILFGARAKGNLLDVLKGEITLPEIMTPVEQNLFLISGGTARTDMNQFSAFHRKSLIDLINNLTHDFDYLLVDTATGLGENSLSLNAAADKVILVLTPDPASLFDAYAVIKVMSERYSIKRFSLVCNQVRDLSDGKNLYRKFNEITDRLLGIGLDLLTVIVEDEVFKRGIRSQKQIVLKDHSTITWSSVARACDKLDQDQWIFGKQGRVQFFWEQVVGMA